MHEVKKNYGLIGKKLDHSFSKDFFTNHFSLNQINASYENIELSSLESFRSLISNFDGFNVTIPYKESILPFLDDLSSDAREIGAVNVIEILHGKCIGHNTDAFGFHQSIKPFFSNKHERAMVLGTGGASKAVAYVLEKMGVDVIFISRSPASESEFSYEQVNAHMMSACKMIVNTTPVGTYPNIEDTPVFPFEYLTEEHFIVDLIYNPVKTTFLKMAEEKGALILNGESMLKEQAMKSYQIWTQHV
jgi:shikimate dehydrogenase